MEMAGVEEAEDMTGVEIMADSKGMTVDVRKDGRVSLL
jgi:hypothetical protein